MSVGPRGAKFTVGTSGQRATLGIPGSGLFYTKKLDAARPRVRSSSSAYQPTVEQQRLSPGFFKRLITPRRELDFIEGMKAFVSGDMTTAYGYLSKHLDQPDAACVAGVIALHRKRSDDAAVALMAALARGDKIGEQLRRYGLKADVRIEVSEHVEAQLPMNKTGVRLALVEVWQIKKEYRKATELLVALRREWPNDVVIKLSLAELFMTTDPDNKVLAKQVNAMAGGIENESEVHTALMMYHGKALRLLGMHSAARDVLAGALRKTKDRSPELLREIRYTCALVDEEMGNSKRARAGFEKIYAEDPDFEDVAKRLGM